MLGIILRPDLEPYIYLLLAYLLAYFVIKQIIESLKLKTTKPVSIITWCIFEFIVTVFYIVLTLTDEDISSIPYFLRTFFGLKLLSLIWIYGIWRMKKWGLIGFTATFIFSQLYPISQGLWVPSLLFATVCTFAYTLVIPYYSFSKMK